MRLSHLLLVLILVAISAQLALAGDIVAMPTGNMEPANTISLGYIYWKTDAVPTPKSVGPVRTYINVGELFWGVTDRLELDGLLVNPEGWGKTGVGEKNDLTELNLYYAAVKENAKHPSLIVGATNLTSQDWLPSNDRPSPRQGDNRISPFVLSAYNVLAPKGPPSWQSPLVRLQLGWGANWSDNAFFGGAQVMLNPKYGVAVLNYQEQPAYLAAYIPCKGWEVDAGWDKGWPLVHVEYTQKF
jgi:hypothetical protein